MRPKLLGALLLLLSAAHPALAQAPCTLGRPPVSFVASDHSRIVQAAMDHALPILAQLDFRGGPPTREAILKAMLNVRQIDPYTKFRIQMVLACLPRLEGIQYPRDVIEEARRRLSTRVDLGSALSELDRLRDGAGDPRVQAAINAVIQILTDGLREIYAGQSEYYDALSVDGSPREQHAWEIFREDLEGALEGAFAACFGSVAAGAGVSCPAAALAGGVVGGAARSATVAIVKLWNRLYQRKGSAL